MMRTVVVPIAIGLAAWISGAGLGGCASGGPRQEPPKNTAREEAPMNGALSPAGDKHPGQIVYDDHVEHKTWTRSATEVPAEIAWVKIEDHWKPVVRIEIDGAGDQREITTFGPNHQFLETTTARLSAPPPAPSEPTPTPSPIPTPK